MGQTHHGTCVSMACTAAQGPRARGELVSAERKPLSVAPLRRRQPSASPMQRHYMTKTIAAAAAADMLQSSWGKRGGHQSLCSHCGRAGGDGSAAPRSAHMWPNSTAQHRQRGRPQLDRILSGCGPAHCNARPLEPVQADLGASAAPRSQALRQVCCIYACSCCCARFIAAGLHAT